MENVCARLLVLSNGNLGFNLELTFSNIEVHVVFLIDFEKTTPDCQIRTVLKSTGHNGVKQRITTVYPNGDALKEETFNCTEEDKII